MANFFETLLEVLRADEKFFAEDGTLLRNKVYESSINMDAGLIGLLLCNVETKKRFFVDVNGTMVFDKVGFGWVINNRQFLPDSYTRFKNRIGLTDSRGDLISISGDVVLSFPYKDCVLEGGQSCDDQKRDEVFYNAILAPDEVDRLLYPKVLVNAKRYTNDGVEDNVVFDKNDNLIIKGNNLLAIASLLKRYEGKIKCIYIDPPYNTRGDANTFLYNNTFNHSTWLTFMKNRLETAKRLLAADGVIAIAIDDEEQAYLAVLCNELFGLENRMGTLVVQSKPSGRTFDTYLSTCHEYILFYSKQPNQPQIRFFELDEAQRSRYKLVDEVGNAHKWRDFLRTGGYSTPEERPNSCYPIYYNPKTGEINIEAYGTGFIEIMPEDSEGKMRVWRKTKPSLMEHVTKGEIKVDNVKGKWKVRMMDRVKDGIRPKSVWVDSKYDASANGTKLLKKMMNGESLFSYPKSLFAVVDVLKMFTEEDDVVLDFFGGSGTTAHAVMQLNKLDGGKRKFIICEQMDYIQTVTVRRIEMAMRESSTVSFIYCELAKCNQRYADEAISAKTDSELTVLLKRVIESGFISSKVNPSDIAEAIDFEELSKEDKKRFIIELLDKNMLYVNLCDLDDEEYGISDADKAFTCSFYGLEEK